MTVSYTHLDVYKRQLKYNIYKTYCREESLKGTELEITMTKLVEQISAETGLKNYKDFKQRANNKTR